MALKNANGNYYKLELDTITEQIINVDFSMLMFKVYVDEAHRDSGDTEFVKSHNMNVSVLSEESIRHMLSYEYDTEKSAVNNLISSMYDYAKTLPEFEGFVDC